MLSLDDKTQTMLLLLAKCAEEKFDKAFLTLLGTEFPYACDAGFKRFVSKDLLNSCTFLLIFSNGSFLAVTSAVFEQAENIIRQISSMTFFNLCNYI